MADKVIVMSDALVQQIGTSRDVYSAPKTKFVAEFIGNNNIFPGTVQSKSGSIVFVEADDALFYVRVADGEFEDLEVGTPVHFSVRADLMHTGARDGMANQAKDRYVATEFLGSLETDVFELGEGHYVHVEQHRGASDRTYEVGQEEIVTWPAEAAVLLTK